MRRLVPALLAACSLPTYDLSGSTTGGTTHSASETTTGTGSIVDGALRRPLDLEYEVLVVVDGDGDNHLDLLLDSKLGPARLVRGHGDGYFDPPIELGDPELGPGRPLGVGDFNGDGIPDLAVWSGEQLLLTGTGPGGAMPTWSIDHVGIVTIADLDRDGRDDLVIRDSTLRPYSSAEGGQPIARPQLAAGGEPGPVHVADLDADGALDLVVANHGTDDLSILRGDGLGNFAPQLLVPALAGPNLVAVADLDADGVLDLLVAGRVGLLALRGLGGLEYEPIDTVLPSDGVEWWHERSAILCDRDRDPYPDVLFTFTDFQGFDYVMETHGGADAVFRPIGALEGYYTLSVIACVDFNEDGLDDYLSVFHPAQELFLALNPG